MENWDEGYDFDEETAMRDPAVALKMLRKSVRDWNEADPEAKQLPMPVVVLEIKNTRINSTVRKATTHLSARCETDSGKVGTYTLDIWESFGWREEPPDGGEDIQFDPE